MLSHPSSDSYQRRKAELSSMTQPWQAEGPRGAESSHPAEAAAGTFRARRMTSGLKAAEKSSSPCLEWAPLQHRHCPLLLKVSAQKFQDTSRAEKT
ncbi:hypothetical protein LEMLEM_LOCUS11012 [Lemmus lemmus]